MRLLFTLSLICLLAAVISAKKQVEENLDIAEPETKEHVSKKYSKDYQKSHHHGGHKHKKQHHVVKEEPLAEEPAVPKQAQVEVLEPEAALQADIETSKKTLEKQKQREQTEDLHLQDLTYEENLKKDKKKKGHRGTTHQAEVTGKKDKKNNEPKLFADQESKNPVAEKVIEDSFEPLMEKRGKEEKNKGKGKKNKSSNNKKAYEKSKDKGKKSKDSKKSKNGKNKDKKNKSKDKKW